ncbi:hypothetical protein Shyd_83660 [Streptomyces hydrogenans]|uniref:Uncharacterized protein n=1 Tax=Streptomyces hydrogenans TaxID=1873719 RepID=A0ABQ3PPQ2_9ACTN|nr:hypothetical protein Shyd_83660 [Streptomyces hydrogenans]
MLTATTTPRKAHGGSPPGSPPTSHPAAPESTRATPIAVVAAMKTSIGQGTDRSPSFIRTVPSAGEEATTAPISATTAGDTPCSGSAHHSATTVPSSSRQRCSGGESGPDTGVAECSCTAPTVIRTGPRRSSLRVVVSSTASAARWEETTASGRPRSSQRVKPIDLPGLLQEHPDGDEGGRPRRSGWRPPTAG